MWTQQQDEQSEYGTTESPRQVSINSTREKCHKSSCDNSNPLTDVTYNVNGDDAITNWAAGEEATSKVERRFHWMIPFWQGKMRDSTNSKMEPESNLCVRWFIMKHTKVRVEKQYILRLYLEQAIILSFPCRPAQIFQRIRINLLVSDCWVLLRIACH